MMTVQKQLLFDLRDAMYNLNKINWAHAGFNMNYWARDKLPETPQLDCGTTCCAYGVGTTLPSWKQAGLSLYQEHSYHILSYAPLISDAQQKLGLSPSQWNYLFNPDLYLPSSSILAPHQIPLAPHQIPPVAVINHIDDILNGEIQ